MTPDDHNPAHERDRLAEAHARAARRTRLRVAAAGTWTLGITALLLSAAFGFLGTAGDSSVPAAAAQMAVGLTIGAALVVVLFARR